MDNLYIDIKRQLEPFKDKVFYYGLTENEVTDIEQKLGKAFPIYFREFLKLFGVRQDFVFGLLRKEIEFVGRTDYLPDEIKKSFILIGDNGGEDFWLLNTENQNDKNIYEWQHWLDGEVVKLGYDFDTLLKENIAKLSDTEIERETNDKKSWCVQFAITTDDEQKIYSTIPLTLVQDWEFIETSPAQVHCYEAKAKLVDKVIRFSRQEYAGWSSPIYYFNSKEPANEFGQKSLIKEIDAKLQKSFPNYGLIDYGILPLTDSEE
ncbi:MAG: SMI1/KNR4 family protein [Chitinophagaceae bacterium]|nr:SMI1/KNR4 family protein [Chitinophagaceae bacterium]